MTSVGSGTALAGGARSWLVRLAGNSLLDDFYLAGSAAVSLHCGQRQTHDLDWMSAAQRLRSPQRRDLLQALLAVDPAVKIETARDGYLFARAGSGTGLRFFYYPYPLLAPTVEVGGCEVASRLDLALMKLAAIISRGTRRDFVDFYLLLHHLDGKNGDPADALARVLDQAPSKFGHVLDFPLQALKGLADRDRAAAEPMPRLSTDLAWSEIEAWLDGPVREFARRQVGLASPEP